MAVENPIMRSEPFYKEAMENAASFNARLMNDRKMRLPFLDSHTGIAQNNSYIWMQKRHRGPGLEAGQLYTYPSRRWRKKRKVYPTHDDSPAQDAKPKAELPNTNGDTSNPEGTSDSQGGNETQDTHSETPSAATTAYTYSGYDREQEEIMRELEGEDDFPDAGEIDRAHSDESDEDFEVSTTKRGRGKGKKTGGGGGAGSGSGSGRGKRKSAIAAAAAMVDTDMPMLSAEDKEKPYPCNICGKRYKNPSGINYHKTHSHQDMDMDLYEEQSQPSPLEPVEPRYTSSPYKPGFDHRDHYTNKVEMLTKKKTKGPVEPNNYCDFCLGDTAKNKNGIREEMVSCAECGHSGHPSCLQFTPSITAKVRSYRWQCIECKSCHLCGTSDNDDQLLFCDDCDRGYHMYCLTPPISSPPDGSWSCELCKSESSDMQKVLA